jgi:hypothetical protein
MSRRSVPRRLRLAIALVAAGLAIYVVEAGVAAFRALPWLQPDSMSYLTANLARAPGYPVVLRLIHAISPDLGVLGPLQHLMLIAGGMSFAWEFARTFSRPIVALAAGAAIVVNPPLVSYAYTVLPEAMFIAVLMAHLALMLALARRWNRATAAGAGATAALLPLLKPAGYAVVAGLVVAAFVHRVRGRQLAWLVCPAAAVLLAAGAVNYAARGTFSIQTQGGFSRAAYVGHLLDRDTPSAYPDVTAQIVERAAPIRRALDALPTIEEFYLVGASAYHEVEAIVRDAIVTHIGRQRGVPVLDAQMFPTDPDVLREFDRIGGALANAAIVGHPAAYARLVGANLYGLWWLPLIQRPEPARTLQRELDAAAKANPSLGSVSMPFRMLATPLFLAVRAALAALIVCSIVGLVLVWSSNPRAAVVGYAAVVLNGYFLLVSLAQPGLPRYAIAAWPLSMLVLFGTIALKPRATV